MQGFIIQVLVAVIFLVSIGKENFYTKGFIYADQSLFEIFSFEFLYGTPKTAYSNINSVVITESIAKKYFGTANAIGKEIVYEGKNIYNVSAVIKDVPENSHFEFECAIPLENYAIIRNSSLDNWNNSAFPTYFLFSKKIDLEKSKNILATEIERRELKLWGGEYYFRSLEDIHLYSHFSRELKPNSDIKYIYIFSSIAFLVLFIALLNYVNLSTARASNRLLDVGLRKVVGASRAQLIYQYLGESILLSFFCPLFSNSFSTNHFTKYPRIARC